jgi:4-amino-4-deoxy-L-arabinose transferase-like glycosyltransferase
MTGVLLFAIFARWLAFTGYFGSDEVTYTAQAFKLLDGDWKVSDYVGANRYGVNFPVALFGLIFGRNEFAAALYSLLSSLLEVALVTWVAYRMFGVRAALFAGLLLASLPTHIHFAGRMQADAPVCLTLTAAFVLFYEGEVRQSKLAWFMAGFMVGLSFWIKPPITVFAAMVLMVYPLATRRLDLRWGWVVVGAVAALALNGLLMWVLTGNFWFIVDAIRQRRSSDYLEAGIAAGAVVTDAHYYLTYLFGLVYHTGLLGYVALLGGFSAWHHRARLQTPVGFGLAYLLLWALGLLLILSLFPVSIRPLTFVPKQTNYILLFVAPLCLLAGWWLAQLSGRLPYLILAACVSSGLLLALLLQGSVAVFTANSWATLRYVQSRPDVHFYVMSNATRAAAYQRLIQGVNLEPRLHGLTELLPAKGTTPTDKAAPEIAHVERAAVVDEQSFSWDMSRPMARPSDVPACWQEVAQLRGEPAGLGVALLRAMAALPGLSATPIGAKLQRSAQPLPARVYSVPAAGC